MNRAPTMRSSRMKFRNRLERFELLERLELVLSVYPSAIISPNWAQNSPMAP